MQPPTSFAPLAGRLAAEVAEIRPAAGAEISWANFMALFFCAIFESLIRLCEALDARAAADAARLLAAPASRDVAEVAISAQRTARQASSGERHAPRLALVPAVQVLASKADDVSSQTIERPVPAAPWLAWLRDPDPIRVVLAPPWRPCREMGLSRLASNTPKSLRYRN